MRDAYADSVALVAAAGLFVALQAAFCYQAYVAVPRRAEKRRRAGHAPRPRPARRQSAVSPRRVAPAGIRAEALQRLGGFVSLRGRGLVDIESGDSDPPGEDGVDGEAPRAARRGRRRWRATAAWATMPWE